MHLVRTYPDPDPMERFLTQDDAPGGFWTLPAGERAQRLRYALAGIAAGLHPIVVWPMVLSPSSDGEIESFAREFSDADVEDMLSASAAERRAEQSQLPDPSTPAPEAP